MVYTSYSYSVLSAALHALSTLLGSRRVEFPSLSQLFSTATPPSPRSTEQAAGESCVCTHSDDVSFRVQSEVKFKKLKTFSILVINLLVCLFAQEKGRCE